MSWILKKKKRSSSKPPFPFISLANFTTNPFHRRAGATTKKKREHGISVNVTEWGRKAWAAAGETMIRSGRIVIPKQEGDIHARPTTCMGSYPRRQISDCSESFRFHGEGAVVRWSGKHFIGRRPSVDV